MDDNTKGFFKDILKHIPDFSLHFDELAEYFR